MFTHESYYVSGFCEFLVAYVINSFIRHIVRILYETENEIDKVIIIETKGEGFAAKFKDKLDFMSEFVNKNNDKFGYQRFDFLYLEDSFSPEQRRQKTIAAIKNFFNM